MTGVLFSLLYNIIYVLIVVKSNLLCTDSTVYITAVCY